MRNRGAWRDAVKNPEKHPSFHAVLSVNPNSPTMAEQSVINSIDETNKKTESKEDKTKKKKVDDALRNL